MKLVLSQKNGKKIPAKLFQKILIDVHKFVHDINEDSVELLLTDDEEIQKINFIFRGKNSATDVLSFGERDVKAATIFHDEKSSLGQIIISMDRALAQAIELNQPLEEELRFLFTHGLLHLLGFDHENPADEKIMLEKAYKILGRK